MPRRRALDATFILFFALTAEGFAAQSVQAQNTALLLFDGSTGAKFAGCLNCSKYDQYSVCNRYGDFGSKYSTTSIWNKYGDFGSKYQQDSPWNSYGEGLRVVDADGNYYGRFTLSRYNEQSKLPLVQNLLQLYDKTKNLETVRDILCN